MKTRQFLNLTAALLTGTISIGSLIAQPANGPSDPQIVGIVLAADQIDIDYGKIALAKSKNKAIREFAQRMVADHSAVQQNVIDLAAKLGVKGEDSPTSTGLKGGAVDITAKLNSLKGKEFDQFYIDNEVSYHKAVTDAVNAVLIPSAQNAELKSALKGAEPLFLKHLEHARMVQAGNAMHWTTKLTGSRLKVGMRRTVRKEKILLSVALAHYVRDHNVITAGEEWAGSSK